MFAMMARMVDFVCNDGTHGGFGYGDRNADESRILEFADGLNLVICNILFMKQESQMVTYATGTVKSTVDPIHSLNSSTFV